MIKKPSMCGLCSLAHSLTDWFDSNPREYGAQSPLRRFASPRAATWQPG